MEKTVFGAGLEQWGHNWGKKITNSLAEFLYSKCKFIPNEAWKDIIEDAMANLDRFPRVKDVLMLWYSWKNKNKEKLIPDYPPETDCSMCLDTGLLEYYFKELNRTYQASQPCGYCQNWKRHISPKRWPTTKTFKVSDLTDKGWEWIEPPQPSTKEQAIYAIEHMFDKWKTSPVKAYQPDPELVKRLDNYEEDIPF